MADLPRLNNVIRNLEAGMPSFSTFIAPVVSEAMAIAQSNYDSIVIESEHNPYDIYLLRDCLQYMLSRSQIAKSGSIAPGVTPLIRIPANGDEKNSFLAKQVLDIGAYGLVWPHIATVEQAYHAVAACRYPSLKSAPLYEPAGLRGDSPGFASRYWGLTQQEYYQKADVWPLNPDGEIFCILMIEDTTGISNLSDILENVPGIGAILIGEGDLSQELGHPRQYQHPEVLSAIGEVVATCKRHDVCVGHPHVDSNNVERLLNEGFRFLMAGPSRSFGALDKGRELGGRS